MSTLRIALLQHACPIDTPADVLLDVFGDMARQAAADGAQLILSQELFTSHYFPQYEDEAHFDLAESIDDGPTPTRLRELAAELGVPIAGSLFERRAPGLYHNTSVLVAPGQDDGESAGTAAVYRKMHIPDDPRFFEKYYFAPGDLGFVNTDIAGARLGMLVCWDQWYPEAARLAALAGAQVLWYPTAIGYYNDPQLGETPETRSDQLDAWITIQRSHAIANGCFVAAVNRIGVEDQLTFWGSSFVVNPAGRIIAQAPADTQCVLMADCDLSMIETQRRGWPFLRDRRIDAYHGLTQRYLDTNRTAKRNTDTTPRAAAPHDSGDSGPCA